MKSKEMTAFLNEEKLQFERTANVTCAVLK